MPDDFRQRKAPVHLPNIERNNHPSIVFLTVCTNNKKKILANDKIHSLLLECWRNAEKWHVGSYMIMPDHIHLFCSPASWDSEGVNKWATFWKRAVSRKMPELQPVWQRSCWDTQLRNADLYGEKWKYVELNPVRQGLVDISDKWPYKGTLNELRW